MEDQNCVNTVGPSTHTYLGHWKKFGYFIPFSLPFSEDINTIWSILSIMSTGNDRTPSLVCTTPSNVLFPDILQNRQHPSENLDSLWRSTVGLFRWRGSEDVYVPLFKTTLVLTRVFGQEGVNSEVYSYVSSVTELISEHSGLVS